MRVKNYAFKKKNLLYKIYYMPWFSYSFMLFKQVNDIPLQVVVHIIFADLNKVNTRRTLKLLITFQDEKLLN